MIQKGDMIFAYNERGRLCRINKGKEVLAELQYNYKNQRVIEKNGDKTKVFVYDDNDRVLGEYGNQGQGNREYIYWEEMPVAFIQDGKIFYYHYDPINFPVLITNKNALVVRQVNYKPYGNIVSRKGTFIDYLLYPGQYEIVKTGLYYNFHRIYSPEIGVYLEPDPLLNFENIYSYALNNPILFKDIKGTSPYNHKYFSKSLGIGGGAFGGGAIIVGGFVCSECFEKNGENKKVCGRFLAIFSVLGGGGKIPLSVANVKTNKTFETINPSHYYPTMSDFEGKSSIATFGIGILFGGFSIGEMRLGNVKNKGFSWTSPAIDFSAAIGAGYCWVKSEYEYCCNEEEKE